MDSEVISARNKGDLVILGGDWNAHIRQEDAPGAVGRWACNSSDGHGRRSAWFCSSTASTCQHRCARRNGGAVTHGHVATPEASSIGLQYARSAGTTTPGRCDGEFATCSVTPGQWGWSSHSRPTCSRARGHESHRRRGHQRDQQSSGLRLTTSYTKRHQPVGRTLNKRVPQRSVA